MATAADEPLDYRTAATQIERALVDRLSLAFQERRPPVADLAALRAVETKYVAHRDLIFVEGVGVCYRWLDTANDPDNNDAVIAATDLDHGRWVKCTDQALYAPRGYEYARPLCQIPTGYARAVQLYEGEANLAEAMKHILEMRPAMLIRWTRTTKEQRSLAPALYRAVFNFEVMCISYCARLGTDSMYGSDLPDEAAEDPGLNQMMGDASDCLTGASDAASTGYWHICKGVDVVQPLEDVILQERLAQRLFMGATRLRLVAYLHRPDRDAYPLRVIGLTTQHVPRVVESMENVVLAGYNVAWPDASLTVRIEHGQAKVGGRLVASSPAAMTFPADADVYRDLQQDGTFIYQAVDVDAAPPAQMAGTLRVGKTTTGGSGVVHDEILAPQITDFAGPDEITDGS